MAKSRTRSFNRFMVLSLALLVGVGAAGFVWLQSSLPRKSGELIDPGISHAVEIVRDGNGIPHIFAENDADGAFALGILHAQDRLWQMEVQRRFGAGRLSEIFGERTINVDRTMRTMGFYRHAEAAFSGLGDETQALFSAYAAGVNAWIAKRPGALPPEFLLLRHTPEPWRPADSLVWSKLMGERLSGNFRGELLRARLRSKLSDAEIEAMWPAYPSDAPLTAGDRADLIPDGVLDQLISAWATDAPTTEASNAWAVHGSRTTTGKPILANDPHLRFSAPILWYLARLETPSLKLTGATVPGMPIFLLGQNQHIAWGMTTTQADLQDIFVERLDPQDPDRYLTPIGSQPFVKRTEVIKIKSSPDETLIVRSTRHGPVISGIFGTPPGFGDGGRHVAALSATYLSDDDRSAESFYRVNRAKNLAETRAALTFLKAPVLNLVFADRAGDIGFMAAGKIPVRRQGQGYYPQAGWDGQHDWQGFMPFAEQPQSANPKKGFVATANNPVVSPKAGRFISRDWAAPYRARRIDEELRRVETHSAATAAKLQLDVVSTMARELVPVMLGLVKSTDPNMTQALKLLSAWDGKMARDRSEPAIFTAWLLALNRALYRDELGNEFDRYWGFRPRFVLDLLTRQSGWCNDLRTPLDENCTDIVTTALSRAMDRLSKQFDGQRMTDWAWGDLHQAVFDNPVFRSIKLLSNLSTIRIPSDGGGYTVNRGTMRVRDATAPFNHVHGPGFRAIYDLADPAKSRFMIATGQSGNLFSPHYRDLSEMWRDGSYIHLDQTRAELIGGRHSTYRILPP